MPLKYTALMGLCLLFLQSCVTVPAPSPKAASMPLDPLVGKRLDTETRDLIPFKTLMDRIKDQDVVYLAEKHDNPMHHAVQRRIIQELVDTGHPPIVGFEFFSYIHTPVLMRYLETGKPHPPKMKAKDPAAKSQMPKGHGAKFQKNLAKKLRTQLGWEDQSDGMWAFYLNLVNQARDNGLMAAGLDLTSAQKKRILRRGMEKISHTEKALIFTTKYENTAYEEHMKEVFKSAHCGMGSPAMLDRQYQTWLARNDTMARSITRLAKEERKGPVVVIVGGGHVRYNLGIVDRVKAMDPGLSQTVVGLVEVAPDPLEAEDYLTPLDIQGFDPVMPAPFLWFTQRVSDGDPCVKFRDMLERMKKQKKE